MDRPFMTWQEKDRLLDEKDKEIKRLQDKYEKPGQKCGNGHVNNLPIKLWDCPVCTEKLRKEKEWLLNRCVLRESWTQTIHNSDDELEKDIIECMQQALQDQS
ncbi:hypothetical protein LCGC14_1584410 [marine sediment metagenome]|uniref:Uncharacterized protein n=1 Tax=marine sediment metagenome TaxID=412755 RepID=A0A0F9KWI4_9ZZZZ